MDSWAIDSYGLRAAHSQSVLDRVRGTDRLHVSPLTWHPGGPAGTGGAFKASLAPAAGVPGHLTLVDSGVSRTRNRGVALDARLRELHDQGALVLAGDHECNPQHVADVEGSWQQAGLVWRPTNETFSAVMTADRLGVDLITDDSDVRTLAQHWQVHPMTVAEFASALAA
jgi:hypothetical protein